MRDATTTGGGWAPKLRVLALMVLMAATLANAIETVSVLTTKGPVLGKRADENTGDYYYSFAGIPYGKAPVGPLRFKDPVEAKPFTTEFNATMDEEVNVCPQINVAQGTTIGDEDCLNLNIFTPKAEAGKAMPVLVYLHGGAFIMGGGSPSGMGPAYLMKQGVVLVTVNYRLGVLGFLATEDGAVRGNMGIKDQILALKWIQDNIDSFGGDPSKVTIFGEDSGAASVSVHTMSPLSKGLFNNAIIMSGSVVCDQFLQKDPQATAEEIASRLGCTSRKGEDIVNCLSRLTHQEIISAYNDMMTFFSFPRRTGPVVDGEVLPEDPERLLQSGKFNKVPTVIGMTKDEGAYFYRLTLNTFSSGTYDDNFLDHRLPRILPVISEFRSKLYPLTRLIRKNYFYNVDMESEDAFRPQYSEFLGDLLFSRCVQKHAAALAAQGVPTFAYQFNYRGQYSIANLQGEQVDMGVVHGDDMQYIFNNVWGEDLPMSPADAKFQQNVFLPLLMSFSKTGIPSAEGIAWNQMTPDKLEYLALDSQAKMEEKFLVDAARLWNEEVPKLFNKKKGSSKEKAKDEL